MIHWVGRVPLGVLQRGVSNHCVHNTYFKYFVVSAIEGKVRSIEKKAAFVQFRPMFT